MPSTACGGNYYHQGGGTIIGVVVQRRGRGDHRRDIRPGRADGSQGVSAPRAGVYYGSPPPYLIRNATGPFIMATERLAHWDSLPVRAPHAIQIADNVRRGTIR